VPAGPFLNLLPRRLSLPLFHSSRASFFFFRLTGHCLVFAPYIFFPEGGLEVVFVRSASVVRCFDPREGQAIRLYFPLPHRFFLQVIPSFSSLFCSSSSVADLRSLCRDSSFPLSVFAKSSCLSLFSVTIRSSPRRFLPRYSVRSRRLEIASLFQGFSFGRQYKGTVREFSLSFSSCRHVFF